MSLSSSDKESLFSFLQSAGWNWREDAIFAPGETIWLQKGEPWINDAGEFLRRMNGRLARLHVQREHNAKEQLHNDWQSAVDDTNSLIKCLREVLGNEMSKR
jgi:hypothetical protein